MHDNDITPSALHLGLSGINIGLPVCFPHLVSSQVNTVVILTVFKSIEFFTKVYFSYNLFN